MTKRKFIFWGLLFLGIFFLSIGIFYGVNKTKIDTIIEDIRAKESKFNDDTFKRTTSTIIYSCDNKIINKLVSKEYFYVNKKGYTDNISNAFISIEDRDFKKHKGISIKGTSRAMLAILKHKGKTIQGGSTITQQLVKNVFLTNKRTLSRKLEEVILARKLEKKYSKDKIMEFYLNNIYFGNGAFGIETASKKYFSKHCNQLTLSEVAFLVAIPNSPVKYDPINHKENTINRRNLILKAMLDEKYINQVQYKKALNEDIKLNVSESKPVKDNYLTSIAIDNSVKELMKQDKFEFRHKFKDNLDKKRYQKKYMEVYSDYDKKIRNGGYAIYTSLDILKQKQLQDSIDNGLKSFSNKDSSSNKYKMQGAGVCIDNNTGYIIAAVGGRSTEDEFNRAFLAYRQPGSAIKPFLAYAPAFDNRYHPLSHMVDKSISKGPLNAERTYFGNVSLRYATEKSLNTIPFLLMDKIGSKKCISYLLSMDFNGIHKEDYNPIAAIGGFSKGTSPVEMAGAYSTLEHNGRFTKNTCIKKISYQDGNVLVDNKGKLERKEVYKPESAYMMTDILKGVLTQKHATGYGLALSEGHIAAAKTGTTENSKDGWFCGYTKYFTTVIWCGCDIPEPISNLYGAGYPGHIWKDFMDKIHYNLKPLDFEKPATIVFKNVNPDTGEIVSYDSGIKDIFSQPILNEIEKENKKKKESERQTEIEKDLNYYENFHYTDTSSIEYIDELIYKMNFEISNLIDTDKANEYNNRLAKRTDYLKAEREKCIKLREEEIERKQQLQQIEEENQRAEEEKKRIENEQSEINLEVKRNQENLILEKEASSAVKKVLDFPNNTKRNDPNYIAAVQSAEDKIYRLTNLKLARDLLKNLSDKTSMLQS